MDPVGDFKVPTYCPSWASKATKLSFTDSYTDSALAASRLFPYEWGYISLIKYLKNDHLMASKSNHFQGIIK